MEWVGLVLDNQIDPNDKCKLLCMFTSGNVRLQYHLDACESDGRTPPIQDKAKIGVSRRR
jgi:hypothetical protein